jgi:hypothetical protein
MPVKLTAAQRKALERAVANNGVIIIGGLDGDPIRRDVVLRLYAMGFLHHLPPHIVPGQPWEITPAGKAALMSGNPA